MNTDRWPGSERILDLALDRSPSAWDGRLSAESILLETFRAPQT